jgi:hypothetical protein
MFRLRNFFKFVLAFSTIWAASSLVCAQHAGRAASADSSEFGPVMRAYLGYLKNEQEVVDDRASRREITAGYYHRNSNRIRALREMAIQLVRQSNNDYVPELEAVTQDEFGTLFESRPNPVAFHSNVIIANKFRYLGLVHTGEVFYLFARLDPYEQAALMQKTSESAPGPTEVIPKGQRVGESSGRPRRVVPQ